MDRQTVKWNSDMMVDVTVREIEATKLNIIKEILEGYGVDLGETELFKKGFVKYENHIAGSGFEFIPSHISPDTAIVVKYGMNKGLKLWLQCVEEMGEFYQTYIHTYEGHTAYGTGTSDAGASGGKVHGSQNLDNAMRKLSEKQKAEMKKRQGKKNGNRGFSTTAQAFSGESIYWTICDLFGDENFEVGDDCTAFVSACVHYFAYKSDKELFDKWKKHPQWGSGKWHDDDKEDSVAVYLKALGFEYEEVPKAVRLGMQTKLIDMNNYFQKGDIMVGNSKVDGDKILGTGISPFKQYHHGEIYWGRIDDKENKQKHYEKNVLPGTKFLSESWGSVHDKPEEKGNSVGTQGMPCATAMDPYKNRWRYTGKKEK